MTDSERDNLRRREVLRKLVGMAAVTPALQALVGCGSSDAPPQQPLSPAPSGGATAGSGAAATTMGSVGAAGPSTAAASPSASGASMPAMMTPPPPAAMPPAATAGAGADAMASAGGAAAMAPAAGTVDISSLACVATPDLTEGPFFYDDQMERSDLLDGETEMTVTAGKVLELTIGVYSVAGSECTPLSGAKVDIWHADTQGVYSNVPGGFIQSMDTSDKRFLRGWQTSGEDGIVRFKTIYPGWYGSRAIHIHFKIRSGNAVFNSQFFFDEEMNDKVLADAAYTKSGERITNRMDQVFTNTGPGCCPTTMPPPDGQKVPGEDTLLEVQPAGDGYQATFKVGLMMA
jgi:protocatechuate 3,4-dioxygenase beta subunit